ncbi:MAG: hypothetical protein RTU92_08565 [Candidatus Thorarchaeota archaeon]
MEEIVEEMDDGVRVTRDFGRLVYHKDGNKYDRASAIHNGIIGPGSTLKKQIKAANERTKNEVAR